MARITNDDVRTYGPELIELVEKKALDAVEPYIVRLQNENENLKQRARASGEQGIRDQLDAKLPGWRAVNTDPNFLQWLASGNIYSGRQRQQELREAFSAGSAERVLAFFRGYLAERGGSAQGQQAQGQRQDSNNTITSADVTQFYRNCSRPGFYTDVERANIEGKIHAAAAAGQIRQVKA